MSNTQKNGAAPIAGASTGALNLGPYFIQHKIGSHDVLDVRGAATDKNTKVISFGLKTSDNLNQQWQFVPAGPETPGWWYLQSLMKSGDDNFVMSLEPNTTVEPKPIVMLPKGATKADHQLWSLQSTEELGYWYIQSKYSAANSVTPLVIGLTGIEAKSQAVAGALSFTEFEKQAWGFRPVDL